MKRLHYYSYYARLWDCPSGCGFSLSLNQVCGEVSTELTYCNQVSERTAQKLGVNPKRLTPINSCIHYMVPLGICRPRFICVQLFSKQKAESKRTTSVTPSRSRSAVVAHCLLRMRASAPVCVSTNKSGDSNHRNKNERRKPPPAISPYLCRPYFVLFTIPFTV